MLTRYTGAVTTGALMTGALILLMEHLISDGEFPVTPPRVVRVPIPNIEITPTPPRTPRPPIKRPDPPPVQPRIESVEPVSADPAPKTTVSTRIPIGPPGLSNTLTHRGSLFTGLPRGAGGGTGGGRGSGLLPLLQITPVYPHTAEIQGREGQVTVEFTIMTDGAVTDARVVSSTHPVFEKPALDAAMKSRYQPQAIDGTPVAVSGVRKTFDFQLRN